MLPILRQLGKTCALLGKPKFACEYYSEVLAHFSKRTSLPKQDCVNIAEIHFLFSEALFELGSLDHVSDIDDDKVDSRMQRTRMFRSWSS